MKVPLDKIALGITEDEVPFGSHLIHFWHTDTEFERGVRFLELSDPDELIQRLALGPERAQGR